MGILLDAFHLDAAEESIEAALSGGIEEVVWVHVADLPADFTGDRRTIRDDDRGLPGESGKVDVAGFLRMIQQRGYEGPVTAEPMRGCRSLVGMSVEQKAQATAASLRRVWPS